jgi:hypothetical protein
MGNTFIRAPPTLEEHQTQHSPYTLEKLAGFKVMPKCKKLVISNKDVSLQNALTNTICETIAEENIEWGPKCSYAMPKFRAVAASLHRHRHKKSAKTSEVNQKL